MNLIQSELRYILSVKHDTKLVFLPANTTSSTGSCTVSTTMTRPSIGRTPCLPPAVTARFCWPVRARSSVLQFNTCKSAASKILSNKKPVVGINTDPLGSEGYMCLTKKLPQEYFTQALKRLLTGDFRYVLWGDCEELESSFLQLALPTTNSHNTNWLKCVG